MKDTVETTFETTVVTRVAAEDLQPGDYITVLNEIVELPSYLWSCCTTSVAKDEPVRVRYLPATAGQPYKVLTVCLPFVYAEDAQDKLAIFDTRLLQLVRLDQKAGQKIWKKLRKT